MSTPTVTAKPGKPATLPADLPANPPAPEATCGQMVKSRKDGKEVDLPCIRKPGHEGTHRVREYVKVDKSRATVALLSTLEDVPEAEDIGRITEVGDRDETQKLSDEHVRIAHEQWVAAGKPVGVNAIHKAKVMKRYYMEPEDVEAVKAVLRSAASFNGVYVRILPAKKHPDGRTMLFWFARDKGTKPAAKPGEKAEGKAA